MISSIEAAVAAMTPAPPGSALDDALKILDTTIKAYKNAVVAAGQPTVTLPDWPSPDQTWSDECRLAWVYATIVLLTQYINCLNLYQNHQNLATLQSCFDNAAIHATTLLGDCVSSE